MNSTVAFFWIYYVHMLPPNSEILKLRAKRYNDFTPVTSQKDSLPLLAMIQVETTRILAFLELHKKKKKSQKNETCDTKS